MSEEKKVPEFALAGQTELDALEMRVEYLLRDRDEWKRRADKAEARIDALQWLAELREQQRHEWKLRTALAEQIAEELENSRKFIAEQRDEWKNRAKKAEETLAGMKCWTEGVEDAAAATIVAMIRQRFGPLGVTRPDIYRLVDDIERGEWRK